MPNLSLKLVLFNIYYLYKFFSKPFTYHHVCEINHVGAHVVAHFKLLCTLVVVGICYNLVYSTDVYLAIINKMIMNILRCLFLQMPVHAHPLLTICLAGGPRSQAFGQVQLW